MGGWVVLHCEVQATTDVDHFHVPVFFCEFFLPFVFSKASAYISAAKTSQWFKIQGNNLWIRTIYFGVFSYTLDLCNTRIKVYSKVVHPLKIFRKKKKQSKK